MICYFLAAILFGMGLYLGKGHSRCFNEVGIMNGGNQSVSIELAAGLNHSICSSSLECWRLTRSNTSFCSDAIRILGEDAYNSYALNKTVRYANFDNVGAAMVLVFTTMTMSGWTDLMYAYDDAAGWLTARIFFCAMIGICSLFMINLASVVITNEFHYASTMSEGQNQVFAPRPRPRPRPRPCRSVLRFDWQDCAGRETFGAVQNRSG
jgi:hypothetical protein